MKKLLFVLILAVMGNALAGTTVQKKSEYIDEYGIGK